VLLEEAQNLLGGRDLLLSENAANRLVDAQLDGPIIQGRHRLGTYLVGPTDEGGVVRDGLQVEAAENCLKTIESQTKRSGQVRSSIRRAS
jgi:hypothetical protein